MKYNVIIKNNLYLLTLLLLCLCVSCDIISTEIVSDADYYTSDELAVIGYLSNYGAIVSIQKTVSPLSDDDGETVDDAVVKLYSDDGTLAITLNAIDEYLFTTPDNFIPVEGNSYYISVTSAEFGEVTSASQQVMQLNDINCVEMQVETTNYWTEDSTDYVLFGKPRWIKVTYYIDNLLSTITNNINRLLYHYKGNNYTYCSNTYSAYSFPSFYINMGTGVSRFITIPDTVSGYTYFYDQITTDSTIIYNGTTRNVIDRIDSVTVQSFTFSSGMINFFEEVNEYSENRYEFLAAIPNDIPSNMSNNVGFFGAVYLTEKTLPMPEYQKGNFTFLYY